MGLSPEDSQHVVDSVALSWPYVGLALLGGLARACRFGVHIAALHGESGGVAWQGRYIA